MIENPFDNRHFRVDDPDTGEIIKWGDFVSRQKVTKISLSGDEGTGLCDTIHNIGVGVTNNPDGLTPMEDYIVVGFQAFDTVGGGYVEEVLIGGLMFFINPTDYANTVGGGLAQVTPKEGRAGRVWRNVARGYKWGFETGLSISPFGLIQGGLEKSGRLEDDGDEWYKPWTWGKDAENHIFNVDLVGTDYHQVDAAAHKIRIRITNTFRGVTRVAYDSELAGCTPWKSDGRCDECCSGTNYSRFLINRPGTWEVTITPMAAGDCAGPEYEETWEWTVEEPDDWTVTLETMSTNISTALQKAGVPVFVTPVALVGGISLVGGLLVYRLWQQRKG